MTNIKKLLLTTSLLIAPAILALNVKWQSRSCRKLFPLTPTVYAVLNKRPSPSQH